MAILKSSLFLALFISSFAIDTNASDVADNVTWWYTEKDEYPEFDSTMQKFGYQWEPIKVQTEDGWVLSIVHVTGRHG